MSAVAKAGHRSAVRRFDSAEIDPSTTTDLRADHPALAEGRTIFPSSVVGPMDSPRFLVSGHNSPKLGKTVLKGPRTGWPIFQLTLEERATCPRSCEQWSSCYGNAMPFARRHDHRSPDFIPLLRAEVATLCRQHPNGLLIRLHVLGDFYSAGYVRVWAELLATFPQLHVFGYTANRVDDPDPEVSKTARAVKLLTDHFWSRFAIRTSGASAERSRSIVVDEDPQQPDIIVCPAQTKQTEACATCGLCWADRARDKTIAFLRHGMKRREGPRLVPASALQVDTKALEIGRQAAPPAPVRPASPPKAPKVTGPKGPALGPLGDGRTLRQIQVESLRGALERLVDATGAVTASLADLAVASGIPHGSVLPVLTDLINAGEVTRHKHEKPGTRAPAPSTYRLVSRAPAAAEPVPPAPVPAVVRAQPPVPAEPAGATQ